MRRVVTLGIIGSIAILGASCTESDTAAGSTAAGTTSSVISPASTSSPQLAARRVYSYCGITYGFERPTVVDARRAPAITLPLRSVVTITVADCGPGAIVVAQPPGALTIVRAYPSPTHALQVTARATGPAGRIVITTPAGSRTVAFSTRK